LDVSLFGTLMSLRRGCEREDAIDADAKTAGTDIVLTTHYLEEADELADQVVVIDHGKVIAAGSTAELKAGISRDVIEVVLADSAQLGAAAAVLETLTASPAVIDHTGRRARSQVSDGTTQLSAAIAALDRARIPVSEIALRLACTPIAVLRYRRA
jgi:ABC-2 type transport system ATP-binding protein